MTNDDFHTVLSVAHQQGVKVMDIFTATRKAPIVRARQLAMYALRLKGYSLPEIGRLLEKDHSTVLHSIETIDTERKHNPELQAAVTHVKTLLRIG